MLYVFKLLSTVWDVGFFFKWALYHFCNSYQKTFLKNVHWTVYTFVIKKKDWFKLVVNFKFESLEIKCPTLYLKFQIQLRVGPHFNFTRIYNCQISITFLCLNIAIQIQFYFGFG